MHVSLLELHILDLLNVNKTTLFFLLFVQNYYLQSQTDSSGGHFFSFRDLIVFIYLFFFIFMPPVAIVGTYCFCPVCLLVGQL